MKEPVEMSGYQLAVDDQTAWLQFNREFGNMVPDLSEDGAANRKSALEIVMGHTAARRLVRMKPRNEVGFLDLDRVVADDLLHTDGFITTDPNLILHANPADCGEIAAQGFSKRVGQTTIALIHASRRIVNEGDHLRALEYMLTTHEMEPEDLSVRLSPSVRSESYKFQDIADDQKESPRWADYLYRDEHGFWHVDFHGRTIADLLELGVPAESMSASEIDTCSDGRYFSHYREQYTLETKGANGLFFAIR